MSDDNKGFEENDELEESAELEEVKDLKPAKGGKSRSASSSSKGKKAKGKSRIAKWFREMRSELKKVIWPTRKQIVQNTTISLVIMVIAALVVWGIDNVGAQIVRAILSLGGK